MPIPDMPIGDNTKKALKEYIERVERLEEEKKGIADDIKEVFANAKGDGFDTSIMRTVIKRRKMEREERHEIDSLVAVYEDTLEELAEMME